MKRKPGSLEKPVLDGVRQVLDLYGILNFRANTAAATITDEKSGKRRHMKMGVPGEGDIRAYPRVPRKLVCHDGAVRTVRIPFPIWIETKAPGKLNGQSDNQKAFQRYVESHGCGYLLVDDVQQVIDWLREMRVI